MASKKKSMPELPVPSLGRILYTEMFPNSNFSTHKKRFENVTSCKGFSREDLPFLISKCLDDGDEKPFCVVYSWQNRDNYEEVLFPTGRGPGGSQHREMHPDTYYMAEILTRHAKLTDAQKQMRAFVAEAKAKAPAPPKWGEVCRNKIGRELDITVRVGDLVLYECSNFVGEGIVWRVVGENRHDDHWFIVIRPIYSVTVDMSKRKDKELRYGHDLSHCSLVKLAAGYSNLGTLIQEERKRLSGLSTEPTE